MTEPDSELINAASTGAAAAVAAVADEQAERERAAETAAAASEAADFTAMASEQATIAVEASTEASGIAYQAASEAASASDVATAAAEAAYDARAEIANLRAEYDERWNTAMADMQAAINAMQAPRQAEPTEVVVTNDTRPDTATQSAGPNTGGSGSAGNSRRHKFGRR